MRLKHWTRSSKQIGFLHQWLGRQHSNILIRALLFILTLNYANATKELHIGSLFPMEAGSGGWAGGQVSHPQLK